MTERERAEQYAGWIRSTNPTEAQIIEQYMAFARDWACHEFVCRGGRAVMTGPKLHYASQFIIAAMDEWGRPVTPTTGTPVYLKQDYDALQAKVSELEERLTTLKQQRIKYGPICLVCGAAEPCHLKDDPHSPCTFDPAPRELWDRCKEQKQRISELEERLVDYRAISRLNVQQAVEIGGLQARVRELDEVVKHYATCDEHRRKEWQADLDRLHQAEAENAALRAELAHSREREENSSVSILEKVEGL